MKLEIQYQRLQTKVAKMEADFKDKTKAIRKENTLLKRQNRDLIERLETAHKAIDAEKCSNKEWRCEKVKLQKEIRDLKQEIANRDARIKNLQKACVGIEEGNIWMMDDYPRVKEQLRDYKNRLRQVY